MSHLKTASACVLLAASFFVDPAAAPYSDPATAAADTKDLIGPSASCAAGFLRGNLPPIPARPGSTSVGRALFSDADKTYWKTRWIERDASSKSVDDLIQSDWQRISSNAELFRSKGEDPISDHDHARGSHGMKARDAAFIAMVSDDQQQAKRVIDYLLQATREPINDLTSLCFRLADGTAPFDAYFEHAAWLLRFGVTYDYVRDAASATVRLSIEKYLRYQAHFLATHLDWNLGLIFPDRLSNRYATRLSDAALPADDRAFARRRYDTAAMCQIDETVKPIAYPVYAYVDQNLRRGPQVSSLSLWYNNRKSAAALAFGAVGLMLDDVALVNRAKRYVREWLTYSVWPDGSQGEYFRNGDYCIQRQGIIYGQYNLQAAALMAHWLAQRGDDSLLRFKTRQGLYGTESAPDDPAKSIALVLSTELGVINGELQRYFHEPWKQTPVPRRATSFGNMLSLYNNKGRVIDNHHALGLLLVSSSFPELPISQVLSRDANDAFARSQMPHAARVATGYGQWQDVYGALPAVVLLSH